jgi:hypothetical protein
MNVFFMHLSVRNNTSFGGSRARVRYGAESSRYWIIFEYQFPLLFSVDLVDGSHRLILHSSAHWSESLTSVLDLGTVLWSAQHAFRIPPSHKRGPSYGAGVDPAFPLFHIGFPHLKNGARIFVFSDCAFVFSDSFKSSRLFFLFFWIPSKN